MIGDNTFDQSEDHIPARDIPTLALYAKVTEH